MTFLHAVILGIIEGITEFLPISSTGHLILTSNILNLSQTDFVKTFEIAIQLGAILAVAILYWKKFFVDRETWKKVLVAFIPTGIIGLILYKIIKMFLLGNEWIVVGSLFIVGIILIIVELLLKNKEFKVVDLKDLSYRQSFLIGIIQSFGMIPGVSRSGATILGGLSMGIGRKTIVEFSFLLAIPTMLAATGYDLMRNYQSFEGVQFSLLAVGLITSFLVAIPFIKFLISFVQKNNFIAFGIYRILVALIFAIFLLK